MHEQLQPPSRNDKNLFIQLYLIVKSQLKKLTLRQSKEKHWLADISTELEKSKKEAKRRQEYLVALSLIVDEVLSDPTLHEVLIQLVALDQKISTDQIVSSEFEDPIMKKDDSTVSGVLQQDIIADQSLMNVYLGLNLYNVHDKPHILVSFSINRKGVGLIFLRNFFTLKSDKFLKIDEDLIKEGVMTSLKSVREEIASYHKK